MSVETRLINLENAIGNTVAPNDLPSSASVPTGKDSIFVEPSSNEFVKVPSNVVLKDHFTSANEITELPANSKILVQNGAGEPVKIDMDNIRFPRLLNNTIGASYILQDSQHGSRNEYTTAVTITLNPTPAQMIAGFLSFHVNTSGGVVNIDYDENLVSVLDHDNLLDPALSIKQIEDEPSKGGVQIDYIGFNGTTNKMEYHVYGALV